MKQLKFNKETEWIKIDGFNYDIKKTFEIVSEKSDDKFTLELNLISYRGKEDKFDLRRWDQSCDKMLKGLALDKEEIIALRDILNRIEIG